MFENDFARACFDGLRRVELDDRGQIAAEIGADVEFFVVGGEGDGAELVAEAGLENRFEALAFGFLEIKYRIHAVRSDAAAHVAGVVDQPALHFVFVLHRIGIRGWYM